jgi:ATP-dependent RNA helicase DeaD
MCRARFASEMSRRAQASDVAWYVRIPAQRPDQSSDWKISESISTRSVKMTNETTPTENGVADAAAMMAVVTNEITSASEPSTPAEPKAPSFDDLGLHPDVKLALDDMGYYQPTAVQTAVFRPVSEGKDLLVQSKTGTGKTTAFGLPIVNNLVPTHRAPQALILAPTRELALQVSREITQLGKHRGVLIEPIYGGAPIGKQINALRDGVHVIVGTPGRVLDHIGRRTLDLRTVSTFVLDECDEMLSMGFLEDIEKITSFLPEKHQTLLFSATMPDEVQRYARRHMKAQEQISLSRDSVSVAEIHHAYYIVSGIARSRDLLKIIFAENPDSAIIFCNTRDETTMVAKFLQKQGLDAEPLSSDLSQSDRERVMGRSKAKSLRFLVATDVAARGIDISDLSHVINYSVPESPEVYVHRTGRTGRAGKRGTALSMVGPRELGNFRYVRLTFGIKPEERVLPKDDIFVGKLKVPLPPIGVPTPPDPVQVMIRGVTATPSELERQIFEKLLGSASGKRVLAALVADKLNQLTTKTSPRPRRPREERADGGEGGERTEAGERGEGGERGERRFDRDRGGGGERGDRGDRPRFGDRERGDRGDRPRFADRERGGGGERGGGERGGGGGGERGGGERGGGERGGGERGDRPRFGDRDRDRGETRRFDRDRDRDRDGRRDRNEHHEQRPEVIAAVPAQDATLPAEVAIAPVATEVVVESERHEARDRHEHRDRDRGRGRDRDRDRDQRHEQRTEPRTEPRDEAPAAEAEAAPASVEDVAKHSLERADRGKKRGRDAGRSAEPTAETREFWETWADNKSTREPEAAPAETAAPAATEDERPRERTRERGRDKDRDRGGRKRDKETEREGAATARPKREVEARPAPAAEGAQARLFISLGKKHGVTADDLRTLLAGPIGGDTARIGSVSLRDSHAHVRVPEELVDSIISGVHGTTHGEHAVTVERSRS